MEFPKKKKTRRGGKGRKKTKFGTVQQMVDPQPMDGSTDPLARKAKLAEYLKAKGAGKNVGGTAAPLRQSSGMGDTGI